MFFDINVLVSTLTARGLCADLLRLIFAEHELLKGEVVLGELQRVLRTRLGVPAPLISEFATLQRGHATVVPKPLAPAVAGVNDSDDEWVITSAIAARAEALITDDQALLSLQPVAGMPIYSPRGFWQLLKNP